MAMLTSLDTVSTVPAVGAVSSSINVFAFFKHWFPTSSHKSKFFPIVLSSFLRLGRLYNFRDTGYLFSIAIHEIMIAVIDGQNDHGSYFDMRTIDSNDF